MTTLQDTKQIEELKASQEVTNKIISDLISRINQLESRLLGKNRHRWDVIEKITDYFMGAQVSGDYAEFGVYRGETFAHACKFMSPKFTEMQFWAFDSFEGLPQPKDGIDSHNGYSGGFYEGQFSCDETYFIKFLLDEGIDLSKIHTVTGWYSDTLSPGHHLSSALNKIAFAWIDCDLYESTVPVLDYIVDKISVGSVILFDDWRCFRNLAEYGQQKACREWLERNPNIKLNLLIDNDYNGYAFTVAAC